MRILHVVPTYLPATRYGGPIHSVHGLCKALAAEGHDVHVVTTSVDGPSDSDVPLGEPVPLDGVNVWYFPSRMLRRLYWSPPMLRNLKGCVSEFDITHTHSVFLWPTSAAARVARGAGVPCILSPRGMLVGDLIRSKSRISKTAWIRLIERRNLAGASAIHVTSEREREDVEALGLALSRIVVIPNGVDVSAGAADHSPVGGDLEATLKGVPYALYLGRLSWKKRLDSLIRAWQSVPTGRLVIAGNDGEGIAPRLHSLIGDLGLQQRVSLVARQITAPEKRTLFHHARVTVLLSISENFGNVALEAMAAGCPVIVSPQVGAAEIVSAAGGGLVADERDLTSALCRLMRNEQVATDLARNGRNYVEQYLAWDSVAMRMARIYRELATARFQ